MVLEGSHLFERLFNPATALLGEFHQFGHFLPCDLTMRVDQLDQAEMVFRIALTSRALR